MKVTGMDFAENEIFGSLGDMKCWIGGGYNKENGTDPKQTRATVMLNVDSVGELFTSLKDGGAEIVHKEPVKMNDKIYWLQFKDPSGNIIEVLGEK